MPMDQLPPKAPPTAASAEDVREALVPVQMRVRGSQIVGLVDHMGNELGFPLTAVTKPDGEIGISGTPEAPNALAQSVAWAPAASALMPMPAITLLDACQSGWSNNTANGTVATDTTGGGVMGPNCIKITCAANSSSSTIAKKNLASPVNVAGKQFGMFIKIRAGDYAKISEIRVYWMDSAGTNSYSWVPVRTSSNSPKIKDGRWDRVHLSVGSAGLAGSDPRATLQQLRVTVIPVSSADPAVVWVGGLYAFEKSKRFPNGVVSITFDDGYAEWPEFAKRMAAYGYRGTGNLIMEELDRPDGKFMTRAVARSLKSLWGWELTQHGNIYWRGGTGDEYVDSIPRWNAYMAQQRAELIKLGAGAGCNVFAYPGGKQDYELQDNVGLINSVARTIDSGSSTNPIFETLPPGNWLSTWAMSSISSAVNGTPVATVTDAITRARAEGGWLILVFHRGTAGVPESSMFCNYDDFNGILAAIAASGMACLPMGEVATSPF